jgi:lipopolysaccharide biosynthesis glycosyltransferase
MRIGSAAAGGSIVVACAADHRYACPLAVMLRSLVEHLHPERTLEIYVVDGGLGGETRRRVTSALDARRVVVHWLSPERSSLLELPLWGGMSIATYDKLLVAALLPKPVSKVLWLDSDLLVLADVGRLWDSDLGDHTLMAVQDSVVPHVSSRFGIASHRSQGLDPRAKYFNAGVMLLDLARWRDEDVCGQALAYLHRHRGRVWFMDQEALNAVLADRWGELDPRWNRNVGVQTVRGSEEEAWILHFSGNLKPWRYRGRGRPHGLYYRHLDATAWVGWRPDPSLRGAVIAWYERSTPRRWVYPLEPVGLQLVRWLTRRYATEADLRVAHPGSP